MGWWEERLSRLADEYKFIAAKSRSLKAEFVKIDVPVIKAVSAGYDRIKITWSAVTGAAGYEVYRYNPSTKQYERISTTTATSYTNTGLTAGKIDMVITKSISRFARNTLDCLKFIRMLKDKNIAVFFGKENISSLDAQGEIMLTIMASLAQQESQSLSQNVKLGIQYRYQQGEIQINHNWFLGYTKDENKRWVIDPVDAEIVKRIFREYLEGASLLQIGRGLEADGIPTATGKPTWRPESIKKILENEKYIGDALLQKTYTVDFLTKKRVVNNGIVPQYYVENSHEAIIPRELFMQVQEEFARRANLHTGKDSNKRLYSAKYALSSIVFCGECGEIYRRVHWNNRGCRSIVWRCVSRLEERGGECTSATISEEALQRCIVWAINLAIGDKDCFLAVLQQNIAK
jgi:site-specific DNA recombinase